VNRIIGIVLAITWVAAMAALIQRDVLPFWTAHETPKPMLPAGDYQVAIHHENGTRLGTSWITTTVTAQSTLVRSTTVLDSARISSMLPVAGTWTLSTDLSYDAEGVLTQFHFGLLAPGLSADVNAERLERDYSCIARLGSIQKTMLLDGELSQSLAESLRPFTHLGNLRVGQSWRVRLLDPLAIIKSESLEFRTQIAKVTGRRAIRNGGRTIECFRIQTPSAVAYADDSGLVVRQEVQLPLGGRWILTDEPYDPAARRAAFRGETHQLGRRRSIAAVDRDE